MTEEHEPDYRMSLAAERTFLAYLRTGLALVAAGVAVAAAFPQTEALLLRRALGVVLVLTGAVVAWEARRRLQTVERAMRLGRPLPASRLVHLLSGVLVAVAAAAVVLVVVM